MKHGWMNPSAAFEGNQERNFSLRRIMQNAKVKMAGLDFAF
jgi:hypothetical protein